MSYQTGKMGIAEGIGLVFGVTISRIFLTTPVQTVHEVKEIAWFAPIVGAGITLAMVGLLIYITSRVKEDLFATAELLLGRAGAWIIAVLYIVAFLGDAALTLRQFAENTLLTALPFTDYNVITTGYSFVAIFLVYLGIEAIARTTYIILPFAILALSVVLLMLAPFYNLHHLAPYLGVGLTALVPIATYGAGVNMGALVLPILASSFQNTSALKNAAVFGIGGTGLLKGAAITAFLLVFGIRVGEEKVLPFFEMARLVYLSRYLQRIESLFIVFWVIAGVIAIAISLFLALYLFTRLLRLPSIRPLLPITAIVLLNLSALPPDIASVVFLDTAFTKTYLAFCLYAVPLALLGALLINRKRRKPPVCPSK